jgi:endonuclease-3
MVKVKVSLDEKQKILSVLHETYNNATTALYYNSPFELLIAVILSAQCTDERVNIITARLFPRYNTPRKIVSLGQQALEACIRDCGLFHSKARNIIATCNLLLNDYGDNGQIPQTFDELIKLPGVGRKTANVLLSQLFNIPAIAVDTHVFRVANRLGLAIGDNPREVEEGLMKVIPKDDWKDAHHWLLWHGRLVCKARQPKCAECPLNGLCVYAKK